MCYSKEVSQRSFIINMITSYILYTYTKNIENKIFALVFAFVGFMQLYDWIFWENQDISDVSQANINFITTKIAMISNHLQPIIIGLLIYYFKGTLGIWSKYMLLLYFILIVIYSIKTFNKITYTLTENVHVSALLNNKEQTKTSLFWEWNYNEKANNGLIYTIFLLTTIILFYENISYPMNIIMSFIIAFTYGLSSYLFKYHGIGRFWCNFAAFVPLFILFINT
jgi:hypothetical protein